MVDPIKIEDVYDIKWLEDVRVSPKGDLIAYVQVMPDRLKNTYRRSIWLATLNGEYKQFTAGTHQDHSPRWSPDGKTLAFVSTRNNDKPQIYLIPVDGGEAQPLTALDTGATDPAWRPDGTEIAFLSRVHELDKAREGAVTADAQPTDDWEKKRKTEENQHIEEERLDPRVIRRLPYRSGTSFLDDRHSHIYVIPVERSDENRLACRLTDGDQDYGAPAWHPNGTAILSHVVNDEALDATFLHKSIISIDVASQRIERLTPEDDYTNLAPLPSPDGRWIAYLRLPQAHALGSGAHLVVQPMDASLSEARDLATSLDRPIKSFRWAPDSLALYFIVEDRGNRPVYRIRLEDAVPQLILVPHQGEFDKFSAGGKLEKSLEKTGGEGCQTRNMWSI